MKRISKENYYLNMAETALERSTCLRRKWGAVIVKNDEIISTGYNGAPRGRKNCDELGYCIREKLNIPRGERYELCRSVHAEQNAIISAPRKNMIDATLVSASIIMIMFKNDGRGLQDLLANTKVVYVNNSSEAIKEAKVIEKSNNRKKENL